MVKASSTSQWFRRFNSIDADYLHTDKHMHTTWGDGEGTLEAIVKKAQEMSLRQIAFTEHIREDSTYFQEYFQEIKRIQSASSIELLVGFEAKIKNFSGDIDVSKEVMEKADIKIASVHRFPIGRKLLSPKSFSSEICQEIELELSLAALQRPDFNVLGHPGGMSLRTFKEFSIKFFEEIILACVKSDVAFDLNSSYHLPVLKDLKKLLQQYNPYVSLGSDAHKIADVGNWTNIWTMEESIRA